MQAYIIRRVILIIPTLLVLTFLVFLSVRFIPGDVIEMMVAEMGEITGGGAELTPDALRHALGLDVPVHVQYARWLGVIPNMDGSFSGLFQGNLGESLWKGTAVTEELIKRLPISVELGILAILTALVIALPVGTYSAIRQDSPTDYMGRTFAILMLALPNFWLATMVVVYPSIWWSWSPPIEYIPIVQNPLENLTQFILPALIMGTAMSASTMRITRTMMLEVLRQDYIRTAWAKGLSERTIIIRHAVRNAFIPVVTMIGFQIPLLVGGSVIMEQIFCLPGIGRLFIEALNSRDYPIVSGINTMIATVVMVNNLFIDLTYAWLDPRTVYK